MHSFVESRAFGLIVFTSSGPPWAGAAATGTFPLLRSARRPAQVESRAFGLIVFTSSGPPWAGAAAMGTSPLLRKARRPAQVGHGDG
jgi:hypothetical protein